MVDTFERAADEIVADLTNWTQRSARDLVINTHAHLRILNPVLTRWSASNWVPTPNKPPDEPQPITGRNIEAQLVFITELRKVSKWTLRQKTDLWIYNNVPYVPLLNRSHRVAKGFVLIALRAQIALADAKHER